MRGLSTRHGPKGPGSDLSHPPPARGGPAGSRLAGRTTKAAITGVSVLVALGPFKEKERIAHSHQIDFTPKGLVIDFAVADWDRDGKPDLLVRQVNHETGEEGIDWYKNLGGPGLTQLAGGKRLLEIAQAVRVGGFCVCDWSGDGWPGLMVTRQGSVWFYPRE